jgi:hydroxymethylpyrimidine pyrophosphatase-like HAD family hydrolase
LAVRLIVFDLDGTLLRADNRLSTYSISVLDKARSAGLVLVAATGRSRWAADLVLAGTDAVDHVICSNGAVLYQRSTGRTIWRRTITSLVTELHARVDEAVPGACWAWETGDGIVPDAAFRRIGETPGRKLDELIASPRLDLPVDDGTPISARLARYGPVVRGLLTHPEVPPGEIVRRLRGRLKPRLSSSSAIFLEVTAPGIHKGVTLRRFCQRMGVTADEVVAYGDHMNDLEMLRWAGRGIAMKGGHDGLVLRMRETTDLPHDQDGAAVAIEKLIADL